MAGESSQRAVSNPPPAPPPPQLKARRPQPLRCVCVCPTLPTWSTQAFFAHAPPFSLPSSTLNHRRSPHFEPLLYGLAGLGRSRAPALDVLLRILIGTSDVVDLLRSAAHATLGPAPADAPPALDAACAAHVDSFVQEMRPFMTPGDAHCTAASRLPIVGGRHKYVQAVTVEGVGRAVVVYLLSAEGHVARGTVVQGRCKIETERPLRCAFSGGERLTWERAQGCACVGEYCRFHTIVCHLWGCASGLVQRLW